MDNLEDLRLRIRKIVSEVESIIKQFKLEIAFCTLRLSLRRGSTLLR